MALKYTDIHSSNHGVNVLFRREGKLAFVMRANTSWMNGFYTLPGGRVDEGEKFAMAAIREAKEEVGAEIVEANLKLLLTWQRHYDDGDWTDLVFEATSWSGELYNAEPNIHSELVWLDPSNLPDNVLPENKFLLDQIAAGNNYAAFGWD